MGIQRLPILVFDYSLELEACRIAFYSLQVCWHHQFPRCWYLPLQTNTQHPAHLEFHSLNLKDDSCARQKMMDATPFPSKRTELKFLNSILNGHSKLIATQPLLIHHITLLSFMHLILPLEQVQAMFSFQI